MSDDLSSLEAFAGSLIASLEPAERQILARDLARQLRERQSRRIADQQNPDGTPYAARKHQLRNKRGRIRRTMFAKLRTNRFLKAESSADAAIVSFTQDVARMAREHQFGLRGIVNRKTGLETTYPARRLLGLTLEDEALIAEVVTAHLADRL